MTDRKRRKTCLRKPFRRIRRLVCELLEPRIVLDGASATLFDTGPVTDVSLGIEAVYAPQIGAFVHSEEQLDHDHSEASESQEPFYLPPQRRLSGPGELLTGPAAGEPFQIATDYITSHAVELGLPSFDAVSYLVTDQYTDERSGITHIYLRQTYDGLEVMNADLSINISRLGEVINVSSSFIGGAQAVDGLNSEYAIDASRTRSPPSAMNLGWGC